METRLTEVEIKLITAHGSYLQGMETIVPSPDFGYDLSTDPTYKEWKLEEFVRLFEFIPSTDPTYKEWKLI